MNLKAVLLLLIICNPVFGQQEKYLTVSPDGHTLRLSNGKSFFWLADTGWEMINRLTKDETDYYLETRSSQGYNVIQTVILSELNGGDNESATGEKPFINANPETPNEKYFRHVDYVIKKAASLNIYLAILPVWGRYWSEDSMFNPENAYAYGKFLGKRYKDQWNIVWILGGDRIPKSRLQYNTIERMAAGLRDGDEGKHLISFHPAGSNTSETFFGDESWLDFNMSQSGHAHRDEPNFLFVINAYMRKPAKPFIDGEPRYEDIPVRFWEMKLPDGYKKDPFIVPDSATPYGYFNDYDIRRAEYWAAFSGAAGITYGNGSIWCFWEEGKTAPIAVKLPWQEALFSPGALQMKYLKKLIDKYGIENLVPDRSLIVDNWSACSDYQAALKTRDNRSILVYTPEGKHVRIFTKKLLSGKTIYRWYNPRNGVYTEPETVTKDSLVKEFNPPSQNTDWVLIIDSRI
jgi:hypothetical protein